MMAESNVFLMDCMDGMREYPDKYFDLAVVDPPYGGVKDGGYKTNQGGCSMGKPSRYECLDLWKQRAPGKEYFGELFRVSKNQIIWGWNNFPVEIGRPTQGYIVWDKKHPDGIRFADCEIAWTSFDCAARIFRFRWNGMMQEDMKHREKRIHPTQKPVALYKWLFEKFARPGDKILDTHLGSGSSRIAAWEMGLDFTGFEISEKYFADMQERFEAETAQMRLEDYE